jgi:SAM-dependent methyltransferase
MSSQLQRFIAEAPHTRTEIAAAVTAFAHSLPEGTRLLDAGAGEAPYRDLFAQCDYRTHDWPGSPHTGAAKADVIADIAELPIEDGSLDAILCTEVLEHVRGPHRAAAELRRVLAPGGRVLITVPFVGELHEEPYDFQRFTSHGLRALLEDAGFTDIVVRPLGGWGTTFAQLLRNAGLATGRAEGPWRPGKVLFWLLLVASVGAGKVRARLDRADHRKALPVGWAAEARVA